MYTPSDKYLKASKKLDRKPRSKVIVDGIEYTGMDRIKDHPKISHNAERMIGEFPTKECKFSIFNRDNTLDLVGKDIQVFRGLLLEDNTIEYIPQGIFHVNPEDIKTNSTAKTIELTIKDKSIDFDTPYGGIDKITYPCTLGNFINEIITRRGFVLETPDFPFHNLILNERPNFDLNTATERYLIASAGELGGCTVQMSRIGGVRISKPYLTGVTIKKIDYKKLPSKEKTFGPINQVTLSRSNADNNDIVSKDDDSISQNGLYELRIIDNPYVDLVREQIVDQVASNLFGMTIVPFELEDVIDSYLYDINDSVAIVDKMNNVFDTTIMSISSSSRIFTKLKASVQNKTEANIKLAGSSKEILNQVKLDVDHNKQRIEALASEVTETSEKTNVLEITVDGTKQIVSSIESNLNSTEQDISQIKKSVENLTTATEQQINIINETIENGVSKVVTTSSTFDENGLLMEKSGEQMSLKLDWDGMDIIRDKGKGNETKMLTVRSDGMNAENITVRAYLTQRPIRREKGVAMSDGFSVGLCEYWVGE